MKDTYYQMLRRQGYSRRDFIRMCAIFTASLGLDASYITRVAEALENKPRLPVIYLHLQECTCCAESFIRTAHPMLADMLFNMISLSRSSSNQSKSAVGTEVTVNCQFGWLAFTSSNLF